MIREHNERAWAIHTLASLQRADPRKPLPSIDKLRIGQRRKKTWQEIKAALMFAMPPNPTRQ